MNSANGGRRRFGCKASNPVEKPQKPQTANQQKSRIWEKMVLQLKGVGESQRRLEADRLKTTVSTRTITTNGKWNAWTMYVTVKTAAEIKKKKDQLYEAETSLCSAGQEQSSSPRSHGDSWRDSPRTETPGGS
ncbi:hypothetical protein BgiMline_009696 [Biomphalaria glabrata]|nr:hypothetical protein BgiMline_023806 [Biomphalaria glabrata]